MDIETDYLVVGAGASGLAFADSLLAEADVDMVLVDRRDRPGGHWRDATRSSDCTRRRRSTA